MPKTEAIASASGPARTPKSDRRFVRYAWAILAYNIGVVLWGAFVRATGSGAGCGNHWPLCNGVVAPRSPSAATVIEFTHRLTSGLDLVLVALLVVWAFRRFPARHPVRLGAVLSGVFLATEALIGAGLVLLEHVAANASVGRIWSLSLHLINTLTLLACLTLTALWAGGHPPIRIRGRAGWRAGFSVGAVALMGVTGAIAALGDTLFPAPTLAAGLAQDFDAASNLFVRLRWLHPVVAAAGAAWLLFFAVSTAGDRPETRVGSWRVVSLVGIQFVAGIVNLLLLAPVWMQIVHLLLADLLWISLVVLCASTLAQKTVAKA
jgi:heme A synthase